MEVPKNLEDFEKAIDLMEKNIDQYKLKMEENQMKRSEVEQSICETEMLIEKALHIINTNERINKDFSDTISEVNDKFQALSKFTCNTQKNKSLDNLLMKVENLKKDHIYHKNEFDKINCSTINLKVKKDAIQQVKKKLNQIRECGKEILSKLNEF